MGDFFPGSITPFQGLVKFVFDPPGCTQGYSYSALSGLDYNVYFNPGISSLAIHMTPLQDCLKIVSDLRAATGATYIMPLRN